MTRQLYEHQTTAGLWLATRQSGRGLIADPPGLGKTSSVIAGLDHSGASRPLIVCPAIVRTHWQQEFGAYGWKHAEPVIHSYAGITRGGFPLMAELIRERRIDSLVLDESHYCKHASSKRARLLLGRDGYARRVPYVFAASGTPIAKHAAEFWTTLSSLFPEVALKYGLRTYDDCVERYCVTRGRMVRGKWIEKVVDSKNVEEFRELMAEVMLRRSWDEVGLDVPPLDWQVVPLDVTGGYEFVDAETQAGRELVAEALRAGAALEDIADEPEVARMRRRLGEFKASYALDLLRSQLAISDEKVVVFAYHRAVLDTLRNGLHSFGVAYVDGDVPQTKRAVRIERFQHDPDVRVFLGQNVACQTGITLTAANRAVLVEQQWTATENYQLGRRIARIGQKSAHCVAQMLTLAGTLDDAVVRQHHREVRTYTDILGEV